MISSLHALKIVKNNYETTLSLIYAHNLKMQILLWIQSIAIIVYVCFVLEEPCDTIIIICSICIYSARVLSVVNPTRTLANYARKTLSMFNKIKKDESINVYLCFFLVFIVHVQLINANVKSRGYLLVCALLYNSIRIIFRKRLIKKLNNIFKCHRIYCDCICNYDIIITDKLNDICASSFCIQTMNNMCCVCLEEHSEVYKLSICACKIYYCSECIHNIPSIFYCTVCKKHKKHGLEIIPEKLLRTSSVYCVAQRIIQSI